MTRVLPTGVVAFLFTDVEGSTRLLEELGAEGYAVASDAHRAVIRAAVAAHGGVEVSTHGDAFFCVFDEPASAVAAALAAQEGLAGGALRVRMGIDAGEAVVVDGTYVGLDVNRAARIADTAHGGQVVVSKAVAEEAGAALVELGLHRLKDLADPVPLYQAGAGEFPPLRSLHRTNLPRPATPFLGRERELLEVSQLLGADHRLVTLTGPGGTGKTRLALHAAAEVSDRFPEGVWWVSLAPLRDGALVLPTLARALGVAEAASGTVADAAAALAEHDALLVLDNAEHLLDDVAGVVTGLLGATARLRILVTSRERLRVAGERVYPVAELSLHDAVALFVARSAAAGVVLEPDETVRELCERLDRLPLALELAAARTPTLAPAQLLERLGQRLDLLRGDRDADPRQQTLRVTIAWSTDLLAPDENLLLDRLAVFPAGCTLDAAEAVCGADLEVLQSLLDKSLVRRRAGESEPRYWMLETIRQFAEERLSADDGAATRERLAAWILDRAEQANEHLRGHDQLVWLAVLDDELDSVRVACDRMLASGDADRALRLLTAVSWHWARRGRLAELDDAFERALSLPAGDPLVRCRALLSHTSGFVTGSDVELVLEALELARRLGERRLEGRALEMLVCSGWDDGQRSVDDQLDEVQRIYEEAGTPDDVARLAINRSAVLLERGRTDAALVAADDAIERTRRQGNRHGIGVALAQRTDALTRLGRDAEAGVALIEALEQLVEVGELGLNGGHGFLLAAALAAAGGNGTRAATMIGAMDAAAIRTGQAVEPADLARRGVVLAEAAALAGEALVERAHADGAALEPEAAVELAFATARAAVD